MDQEKMMEQVFTEGEQELYDRHFSLRGFGEEAQRKLKKGKVLVVGAGGLGSPLLLYLAAAGVGQIGIIDFDKVDASNLHRQVIFDEKQVGMPKVQAAKKRLQGINPFIEIETYEERLTTGNAMEIIRQYEVVADGSDNFPTRYLVNDACVLAGKPRCLWVYFSNLKVRYRFSTIRIKMENDGAITRDLYPSPPPRWPGAQLC